MVTADNPLAQINRNSDRVLSRGLDISRAVHHALAAGRLTATDARRLSAQLLACGAVAQQISAASARIASHSNDPAYDLPEALRLLSQSTSHFDAVLDSLRLQLENLEILPR